MSFIEWHSDFSVHHEILDKQHRELFQAASELRTGVLNNHPIDSLNKAFDFLKDYVHSHFEAEEEVMRRVGFPGYTAHKLAHEKLRTQIRVYEGMFEKRQSHAAVDVVTFIIKSVLLEHTLTMDRAYGCHIASLSASQAA